MKILVATKNQGKLKEFRDLFDKFGIETLSLADIDFTDEIVEDGLTFTENALIKARTLNKLYDYAVVSDDSGLEVEVLGNQPGIYSARYAGLECDDEKNIDFLLENLNDYQSLNQRKARYVCAIALVMPDKTEYNTIGYCDGFIDFSRKGTNGFGYDSVFYTPEFNKNMAEITLEEKHSISHRASALVKLKKILKKF